MISLIENHNYYSMISLIENLNYYSMISLIENLLSHLERNQLKKIIILNLYLIEFMNENQSLINYFLKNM